MSGDFLGDVTLPDNKGKRKAAEAVVKYLKDKHSAYTSKTPGVGDLMAAYDNKEFKYKRGWNHNMEHSITVKGTGRVIHVHLEFGSGLQTGHRLIKRAHLIHKLVEEDHDGFPESLKKRSEKLSWEPQEKTGDNPFNLNRAKKIVAASGASDGQVKRQLRHHSHSLASALRDHKETMAGKNRYEIIIFDGGKTNWKYRFHNGKKALAIPLLQGIAKTINAATSAIVVAGLVDEPDVKL